MTVIKENYKVLRYYFKHIDLCSVYVVGPNNFLLFCPFLETESLPTHKEHILNCSNCNAVAKISKAKLKRNKHKVV